ncbi:STAS domain-containing protein [Heliomicrobium gestii]
MGPNLRLLCDRTTEHLQSLLSGPSVLLVDLSQVDRIDLSGISWLFRLYRLTKAQKSDFRLVNVPPLIRQHIGFTKLDRVFQL